MNNKTVGRRWASWFLLLAIAALIGLAVRFQYQGMQAQQARVALMHQMRDTLHDAKRAAQRCDVPAAQSALAALSSPSQRTSSLFSELMKTAEFGLLNRRFMETVRDSQTQNGDCTTIAERTQQIQQQCEACHQSLRTSAPLPELR